MQLCVPLLLPTQYCWMALALQTGRAYHDEIVIERPDGQRLPGLPHITPIYDASGPLLGAVIVLVDLSGRS